MQEYRQGAKTLLEVEADRLPIKDSSGKPTGKFEKVPRVEIAGPGTEGNLKANIVYLHSDDNPYFDKTELTEVLRGARRQLILERGYGVATKAFANQFPKFDKRIHTIKAHLIEKLGTNYHIVDPVAGRNWYMLWLRVHPEPIIRPDGERSVPGNCLPGMAEHGARWVELLYSEDSGPGAVGVAGKRGGWRAGTGAGFVWVGVGSVYDGDFAGGREGEIADCRLPIAD